ncbi:Transposable element Tc3 transposase [Araneus ventricosus]|uniref:Transposable element Tc3 transposase n=1 Tax=Araneus ventricosus TaxID=182803 RepID=A0A4Y2AVY5_ARAVE|nr:Transposable element Tc3 transposase [Araneus ventricosus]
MVHMAGHHGTGMTAQGISVFFNRRQGSGSVMVWAAFCYNGQVSLHFTSDGHISQHYTKILEDNLQPFVELLGLCGNFSKTRKTPIHAVNNTKVWFNSQNIKVLDWPACSPDLNPIENLWDIMCRKVYSNGRQYSSVNELKRSIEDVWQEIEPQIM